MVQKIIQTIKKVTTIPKRSEFKSSREYALQVETSLNEHKEFNNDLVEFAPKLNTAIDEINATTEQIVLNKTATDEALASVQNSKTNIEQTIEASKTDMAQTIQTGKDDISGTIQTAKDDINTSVTNAKQSEDNAKQSELNAKQSETNTSQSEANASLSETNAKQSELNAKQSELNASNIVLGQVFDDNTETNQTGWSSTKIKQEINAIPKVDAYTKAETDNKYLPKTETARNSNLLGGMVAEEQAIGNTIVKRHGAGYVYASFINTTADTRNYNHNITNVWIETDNDHWHRKISTNDFITLLKNRNLNASYAYKNATNTNQGGVKVRLAGTTLYITSNGANA